MKTIVLSVVAIVLSMFSIALYFFKFSPVEVSAIGYISVIATFIAVSVALAIGFQIYQSIVLKNEVDSLKEKVKDIDNLKIELNKTELIARANVSYIAGVTAASNSSYLLAFKYQLDALFFSIEADEDKWMKNFNLVIDNLKGIVAEILELTIIGKNAMEKEHSINFYVNSIKETEKQIRGNKYFNLIEPRFEKLMKALYIRTEKLKKNLPLDREEVESINSI